jgi:hypothetical protein
MHRPHAALTFAALVLAGAVAHAQAVPPSEQLQPAHGTILSFICMPLDEPAPPLDVNIEPVRQIVFYGHTLTRYREDGDKVVWSTIGGDHTGSLDLTTLHATIDDKALRCRPKARKF